MAYTYKAFISYSHGEDSKLAAALHSALHRFARPWYRLRAMHVFRDKISMSANPALWPAIEHALRQSEWLLFFASPAAAESPWVRKEVEWWLAERGSDHLILCITGGELAWDAAGSDFDWTRTTALPQCMRNAFREEPLWVDLRQVRNAVPLSLRNADFRAALLDIAAPLHGKPKDVLDSEDLREHRKLRLAGASALAVIVLLSYGLFRIDQISRERKDTVISHELAGKAYLNLPSNPELSALLALAGIARRQTGLSEVAFRHALAKIAPPPQVTDISGTAPVRSMAFSPDGKSLAVAFTDGRAALLPLVRQNKAELLPLAAPEGVGSLAWVDKSTLLAATATGALLRWDNPGGAPPAVAGHLPGPATQIVADPAGRLLYESLSNGGVAAIDWRKNVGVESRIEGRSAPTAFAVHRSGGLVATGNAEGLLALWRFPGGEKLGEIRLQEGVTALDFNPRGRSVLSDEMLAAGDRHGNLHVFDVAAQAAGKPGALPQIHLPTVAGGISSVAFTGNGKCLVVAGNNGELFLREVNSWNALRVENAGVGGITGAVVGANRQYAMADDAGGIHVFELALCADKNELCAFAAALPLRPLTPEERRRFVAGQRESDNEEPLPPRCQALVDSVLGGQR